MKRIRRKGRIRKSTLIGLFSVAGAIFLIVATAITIYVLVVRREREQYENKISNLSTSQTISYEHIYRLTAPVEAGEKITLDKAEKISESVSMARELFFTEKDLGKPALIDMPEGTHLLKSMVSSETVFANEREIECGGIALSSNLESQDIVDIRLAMPNGEDFIVLSKKCLYDVVMEGKDGGKEQNCFLRLDEQEILYFSAAIVDAYLYEGAALYTAKYIEPSIQEKSLVTYHPGVGTLKLMEEDPNLVEKASQELKIRKRKQYENRWAEDSNKKVEEKIWGDAETENSKETEILKPADTRPTELPESIEDPFRLE